MVGLQIVAWAQHGGTWSPVDYPAPLFVGLLLGLAASLIHHLLTYENRKLKAALVEKDALFDALTKNEERLQLATSRSAIWDWDVERDDLYLSSGFSSDLGFSGAELTQKMEGAISNVIHPDDRASYLRGLAAHLDKPDQPYVNEHRFLTKSGQYKWYLAMGQATQNDAGKSIRFSGTLTDISERMILQEQLQHAQKLDSIGKLTGSIAHDFNNLLAVIMGNFELLRENTVDQNDLDLIHDGLVATQRGADLTKNMLAFARRAPHQPVPIDLNNVVQNANNWMRRGLPETVEVELSLLAGLWEVRLDAGSLENALLNLLLNASDAMDAHGKLTIESANIRIDQAYSDARDKEILPGRYVMLAISDTGNGIPPEILKNIFEPFYTTKGVGQGSGMGLAMVEGFVVQSGGTVQIYTEVGEGTTIKMYFPAFDATEKMPTAASLDSHNLSKMSGCKVLLVEDEATVLKVSQKTLTAAGFLVTSAITGDDAFKIFPAQKFDLLITDIVMPGTLQGPSLAKALRTLDPNLPVIFMSGYASEATVHGNGLRPEDIRLMKPVSTAELLKSVEKALS